MIKNYLKEKKFFLGVNYWTSNAGTAMWNKWDERIIENDLKLLSENNIKVLRVFPLWSDFQPITCLYDFEGNVREISHKEKFLDTTTLEGRSGIDMTCIKHFDKLCKLAKKYNLELIVPLLTGWMSGRCFFPHALEGKNVLTDPFAIKWAVRFVKFFVEYFKNEKTIIAWELGNESNCMGPTNSKDEEWVWTSSIVNAIKACDKSRIIISGMHNLTSGGWSLEYQSELCDMLTIHPYMLFTPLCEFDGIISPRAILHTSAELTVYSDIGNKNCMVEEIGTLNNILGDDYNIAKFARINMFNAWCHNGIGLLWWCGFDQGHLREAPYDWCECERELGLFKKDGAPKPIVKEYANFAKFVENMPFSELPPRTRHAVCLVNPTSWDLQFGSFMIAKRAGLELMYQSKEIHLKESPLYIIPGDNSLGFLRTFVLEDLLKNIKNGSIALITCERNLVTPFEKLTGCKSQGRHSSEYLDMELNGFDIHIPRNYCIDLVADDAEIISRDQAGNPALTFNKIEKGGVFFLNAPIEFSLATTPNLENENNHFEEIYKYIFNKAGIKQKVKKNNPFMDVTEHDLDDNTTIIVCLNNTNKEIYDVLSFDEYSFDKCLYGHVAFDKEKQVRVKIPECECVVLSIKKNLKI